MNYKEKLYTIKAMVFDVDGVLTDSSILLLPDGSMNRTVNVKDGYAINTAIKNGYLIGVITGGKEQTVKDRMQYLGITDIYLGSHHKLENLEDFMAKYGLKYEEVMFMGDDIPDYEVMTKVGLACSPKDAVPEIKHIAHYISPKKGGKGCVRDIIEQIMKVQGKWTKDFLTQSV